MVFVFGGWCGCVEGFGVWGTGMNVLLAVFTAQVHPKTKTAEQDELSSLLQVPIVVGVNASGTVLLSCTSYQRDLHCVCCALYVGWLGE